jgi:hypothetical protein
MARDSSVGIATRYGVGRYGDRIPVRARFYTLLRPCLCSHLASSKKITGSLPRGWSAEVKKGVELHLYSSPGPSWPVLGRTLFNWMIGARRFEIALLSCLQGSKRPMKTLDEVRTCENPVTHYRICSSYATLYNHPPNASVCLHVLIPRNLSVLSSTKIV